MQRTGTTLRKGFWPLLVACVLSGCESHAPQESMITMQRTRPAVTVENQREVPPAVKEYNKVVIYLVQRQWHELLHKEKYSGTALGHVDVNFQLHSDGSVSDLRVADNGMDAALVKLAASAVNDSDFPKWTEEVRKDIGADVRDVSIKFIYNGAE